MFNMAINLQKGGTEGMNEDQTDKAGWGGQ